jgi:hypothetical protein
MLMLHHDRDFTPVRENQKTYRRLLGMMFFGALESLLHAVLQRLATQQIFKNRKNTTAKLILMPGNIDLAAETPKKRPVLLSALICDAPI